LSRLGAVKAAVHQVVATAFGLGPGKAIFSSSQANRISWRELLSNAELAKQPDLSAPYVVVHFSGYSPNASMSMDGDEVVVPLEVFYIVRSDSAIRTAIGLASDTTNAHQVVSPVGIFVGQLLHFEGAGVARTVTAVAGSLVTVDGPPFSTLPGEAVTSDVEDDVSARMLGLRDTLSRGEQATMPFAILEDGIVDASASNLPNRVFLDMGIPLHAGQLSVNLHVVLS
jgi:hypothetical protein